MYHFSMENKRYLVIDLEATCFDASSIDQRYADDVPISREDMEIIEIGAVWSSQSGAILDKFQVFVRPIIHTNLNAFCRDLTTISQKDIDNADTFPAAAERLREFASLYQNPEFWGSWGKFDLSQLERESVRHGIEMPIKLPHVNLKRQFAKLNKIGKEVGTKRALSIAKLPCTGTHHRALDDAVNIASLLPWCLGIINPRQPIGSLQSVARRMPV